VQKDLQNSNWIRNQYNIDNEEQLDEFVMLFMAISEINLTNQKDNFFWKLTANGKYSVALAACPSSQIQSFWLKTKMCMQHFCFVCVCVHMCLDH
jgi:hypothetical protein